MVSLWYLRSSIAQQERSTGSSAGRYVFGMLLCLASADWSVRYSVALSGPVGKKNKYTSVGAGKEEKTTEHFHHVDSAD